MKIGILEAGHPPEDLKDKYGTYGEMFIKLLSKNLMHEASLIKLKAIFNKRNIKIFLKLQTQLLKLRCTGT